jgi:RHS repeat-associated protein
MSVALIVQRASKAPVIAGLIISIMETGELASLLGGGCLSVATKVNYFGNPTIQVTGNSIQKVSGTSSWYDAGAVSSQAIVAGDGYMEFTPGEINTWRMCGLGNADGSAYFDDIDYAFFVGPSGGLQIYESGNLRGSFGTYAASDRLKVAVEGGVVKYYRNSTLVYTSTVAPAYPLQVDTSLNTVNSGVYNVMISSTRLTASPINYVLQDVQGSTRAVMSGTSVVARHDFLPFGEEIGAGTGMRTSGQGFGVTDKIRHRYGLTERDDSTGLDHTWWRKYENTSGRWTSPDPYLGSMTLANPQSFNRYAYVQNDPLNFVDPSGLDWICPPDGDVIHICTWAPSWSGGSPAGGGRHAPLLDPDGEVGGGGGPQNPGQTTTPTPNPNCITNAVAGATGLARPFGNVGPTGIIGHDGVHVVAPPGSQVTTLPALTGTVLGRPRNQGDGLFAQDVLLAGGNVAIYKDLATVSVRPGQRLRAGSVIGTVGEGGDYAGLHFSLLRGGRNERTAYRGLTSTGQSNKITVGMFINPLGPNSPVNCPGVPVNNAGVNPHP